MAEEISFSPNRVEEGCVRRGRNLGSISFFGHRGDRGRRLWWRCSVRHESKRGERLNYICDIVGVLSGVT
jgi:hypothetical protein